MDNQWPALCNVAGQAFCNASPFVLKDHTAKGKKQTLQADFTAYLDGFSPNVQEILDKFKFRDQIKTMVDADILGSVIEKFTSLDINLSPNPVYKDEAKIVVKLPALDNHGTGTIFEELIRKFKDASYSCYDGACGTGGHVHCCSRQTFEDGKTSRKECIDLSFWTGN